MLIREIICSDTLYDNKVRQKTVQVPISSAMHAFSSIDIDIGL